MSLTNGTTPSAVPTGVTTAVDLSSSLSILLVGTVGSSFLIPIASSLLYFVKSSEKRGLTFIMIAASLVLGLGEGGLNMYNQINAIRKKPVPSAVNTTYTMVHLFLPLFSEFTMVLRVGRTTPFRGRAVSWLRKFWTYGPMLVLKILRFVVLVSIAVTWVTKSVNLPNPVQGGLDALSAINQLPSQLRWALQSADTLFMAVLLFPWPHWKEDKHGEHDDPTAEGHPKEESLWVRFKTFFWDAVFSFVIPVALNLVQFALVLAQDGVLKFPSLFAVNNQLGIIGMVFATIWAPGSPSRRDHARGRHRTVRSRTAPPALGGSPRPGAEKGVGDRASTTSSGNASASGPSARQRPGARRHASEMTFIGAGEEKARTPTLAGLLPVQSLGEEQEYDEKASISGSERSGGGLIDGVSHLLGGFGGDIGGLSGIERRMTHIVSGVRNAVGHGIEEVEEAVHDVGDRVRDVEHRVEDGLQGMSEKVQGKMHMIHGASGASSGSASASAKTHADTKSASASPTKKAAKAGAKLSGNKKTSSSVGDGRRESSGSLRGVLGSLRDALSGNLRQRADDLETGIRDLATRNIDAVEDKVDDVQGKADSALTRASDVVRETILPTTGASGFVPAQSTHPKPSSKAAKGEASTLPPSKRTADANARSDRTATKNITGTNGFGLDNILTEGGLERVLLRDAPSDLEHRVNDLGGHLMALTARGTSQVQDAVDSMHDRFEQTLDHARSSIGALAPQSSSTQDVLARRKATREMSGDTLVEGKPMSSEPATSALSTSMRLATQVGVASTIAQGMGSKVSRTRGDLGAALGGGAGLGVGGALFGGALGAAGGTLGVLGAPVDVGGMMEVGLEDVGLGMGGEGEYGYEGDDGHGGQSVGHGDEGGRSVYDVESGGESVMEDGESDIGRALDS